MAKKNLEKGGTSPVKRLWRKKGKNAPTKAPCSAEPTRSSVAPLAFFGPGVGRITVVRCSTSVMVDELRVAATTGVAVATAPASFTFFPIGKELGREDLVDLEAPSAGDG